MAEQRKQEEAATRTGPSRVWWAPARAAAGGLDHTGRGSLLGRPASSPGAAGPFGRLAQEGVGANCQGAEPPRCVVQRMRTGRVKTSALA